MIVYKLIEIRRKIDKTQLVRMKGYPSTHLSEVYLLNYVKANANVQDIKMSIIPF
jgi:hypothetical protein